MGREHRRLCLPRTSARAGRSSTRRRAPACFAGWGSLLKPSAEGAEGDVRIMGGAGSDVEIMDQYLRRRLLRKETAASDNARKVGGRWTPLGRPRVSTSGNLLWIAPRQRTGHASHCKQSGAPPPPSMWGCAGLHRFGNVARCHHGGSKLLAGPAASFAREVRARRCRL